MAVEKELIVKEITYDGSPVLVEAAKRDAEGNDLSATYARAGYKSLYKKSDYLYNADYDVLNYEYAYDYFNSNRDDFIYGSGIAIRSGRYFGHSYDSYYSNAADFCIFTSKTQVRYSSIGMAGGVKLLTNTFVDSGRWNEYYIMLPFIMTDGINENGVFCAYSLVPADWGHTDMRDSTTTKTKLCTSMLVRYVLDNYTSAQEAVTDIQNNIEVYTSSTLYNKGYELHFIIGDANHTYSLETKSNTYQVNLLDDDATGLLAAKPYETGFHLSTITTFIGTGTLPCPGTWTSQTGKPTVYGVDAHGRGLERYNYLASQYPYINESLDTMKTIMQQTKYTRTYTSCTETPTPSWYSEYVGDVTVDGIATDFTTIISEAATAYTNRTRQDDQAGTIQTVHAAIYDIDSRKIYLSVQENYTTYSEFEFTNKEIDKTSVIRALGYTPENEANRKTVIDTTNPSDSKYLSEKAIATALASVKVKAGTGIVVAEDGTTSVDTTVIQAKINSENKLSSDHVDDSNAANKFVTITEKTTWSGKQDAITATNKLSADYIDGLKTDLNQFTNYGEAADGYPYASQHWVEENAGKIDAIQVNGTSVEPVNKVVNLTDEKLGLTKVKATTVDTATAVNVVNGVSKLTKTTVNFNNGSETEVITNLPEASTTQNGLMSISDYNSLVNLNDRVSKLEGTLVRLVYSTKENPTSAEIEQFVIDSGYTDRLKWPGIAVVVLANHHIWNYFTNTQLWTDCGVDTVSTFTNTAPGIILGSETDGKVYAETDGTGSVSGWDTVKTDISNIQSAKISRGELATINGQTLLNVTGGNITIKTNPAIFDESISAGTSHSETINTKIAAVGATPTNGDIFIIREGIDSANTKRQVTTYIYDNSVQETFKWRATDGNYSAANVYFADDIKLGGDYTNVGNVKLTDGTLTAKNKSVAELFTSIFTKRIQPIATLPTTTISWNPSTAAGSYEAGTLIDATNTMSMYLSPGSYTYGPETGVEVKDSSTFPYKSQYTGTSGSSGWNQSNINSRHMGESFTIGNDSVTLKAEAYICYKAATAYAVDNLGDTTSVIISAGETAIATKTFTYTSYRSSFSYVGTDTTTLDGAWIRTNASNLGDLTPPSSVSYNLTIPAGTKRIVFAIPQAKGYHGLQSVTDVGGMGLDVKGNFTHSTLSIAGANGYTAASYDVWCYDNTAGLDATTYQILVKTNADE